MTNGRTRCASFDHCKSSFLVVTLTALPAMVMVFMALNATYLSNEENSHSFRKRDMALTRNTNRRFYHMKHPFQCARIIMNDTEVISEAVREQRQVLSDFNCYEIFGDCSWVRSRHFYPTEPDSDEERYFPIAYVILVYSHLEQIEMLLNAIYAPQNLYCFHVDLKAPYYFHLAMKRLASCFPNVVVTSTSYPVFRPTSYTINAIVAGIEELYVLENRKRMRPWKYLITLQNHDFPLKTNNEIVRILNLYRGFNDVELLPSPNSRIEFYDYKRNEDGVPEVLQKTDLNRGSHPFNMTFYKGSIVAAVSRPFVDSIRGRPFFRALQTYLKFTFLGDELFWSSLNHNDQFRLPGTYPGRCFKAGTNIWVSRFAVWKDSEYLKRFQCHGRWRNNVCVQSTADLNSLVYRPELFVNKLMQSHDIIAIDCLHQLLYQRRYHLSNLAAPNMSYYEHTSAVQYRMWLEAGNQETQFRCVTCRRCAH